MDRQGIAISVVITDRLTKKESGPRTRTGFTWN